MIEQSVIFYDRDEVLDLTPLPNMKKTNKKIL